MVIDGKTLKFILEDHRNSFMLLAFAARTAICNRVTPLQKVVNFFESSFFSCFCRRRSSNLLASGLVMFVLQLVMEVLLNLW